MNIACVLAGSLLVTLAMGQNYCDDAYGAHCPEESGWDVGTCLSKLDTSLQGEKCHDFITLHNVCRVEIDTHCEGKEYTGDVLPCLTEWTSADLISSECKALFPVKPPKAEKRKKTKKEKR